MTSSVRFQVLRGMNPGYETRGGAPRASYEMRRAAVLSYEQLAAGPDLLHRVAGPQAVVPVPAARPLVPRELTAEELARDPRAHPFAPARPQGAARPRYEVVSAQPKMEAPAPVEVQNAPLMAKNEALQEPKKDELEVEPVEPNAEPRHRGSLHGGVENPVRSTLSPSQRAALRRPETRLDRNGRETYVTYTVDTKAKP